MISLIVAASTNNAIGKNNQLLWQLPNDLKYFKNITWGGVVIMGRKTFESVNRPLPGRTNIVITRQDNWHAANVITSTSLSDALAKANATHCKEIFIIGGGEIYKEALLIAQRIYFTRVHANIEGDTFFPVLDEAVWHLISNKDFSSDEKNLHNHSVQVWEKRE